jgi:hypothetical protein
MTEGSGETTLVIDRFVFGLTVVTSVWLLLPVGTPPVAPASYSIALTVTVFVIVPRALVLTTRVSVADAPFARLPKLHVTVPVPVVVPWLVVAETKVTLEGSTSVRVTPVAVSGPLLVTVMP